jgi:hypothetical protein
LVKRYPKPIALQRGLALGRLAATSNQLQTSTSAYSYRLREIYVRTDLRRDDERSQKPLSRSQSSSPNSNDFSAQLDKELKMKVHTTVPAN